MFVGRMDFLIVISVYALMISSCWGVNEYWCKSPQYVGIAQMKTVQCSFDSFYAVAWYNAEDVAARKSFIQLINGKKEGDGYISGEFDISMNGSLVFKNVSLQYDHQYTVFILESQDGDPVSLDVQVVVTVKPTIAYPVIELCGDESTACFRRLNHSSEVTCAVRNVRPFLSLSWKIRHFGLEREVSFHSSVTADGELFTSRATAMDIFSNSSLLSVLVCKADDIPEILLKDEVVVLVENGDIDLSSVTISTRYVEMNSRLQLRCSERNVGVIIWKKEDQISQKFRVISYAALFEENASKSYSDDYELQKDGSLAVSRVEAKHEGLFGCIFKGEKTSDVAQFEVVVFVPAYPFVHGCPQDQYCVLLMQSEGSLICSVHGIRPKVQLEWKAVHEKDSSLIYFTERQTTFSKFGDVFDVQLTAKYKIEPKATDRVTLECSISGPAVPALKLTTKFDLLVNNVHSSFTEPTVIQPTDNATSTAKTGLLWILVTIVISLVLAVILATILAYRRFIRKGHQQKEQRALKSHKEYELIPLSSTRFEKKDPLTEKKRLFVSELKAKYQDLYEAVQPIPYIRDRLYCVDGVFVEGGIEYLVTPGKIGGQGIWNNLSTHHDILNDPRVESTRQIIEGEPGYGKSTVALQLAYEWCKQTPTSSLKNTDILILLKLRQLKGITSINEAIRLFILPKDSKLNTSEIAEILGGRFSVVVILDGFDEYPDRDSDQDSDILTIIARGMFQQYQVIVTTRVSCFPKNYPALTKRIKLTGFDKNARDLYIQKAVVGNDSEAAARIKQQLKENPILRDLCQAPLFFVLFAHMSYENETFNNLNSVTSFFSHMISCLKSHMKNKLKDDNVTAYAEISHTKLDRLAFEGLIRENKEIVWEEADMCERLGKDLYAWYVRLGILVEETVLDVSEHGVAPRSGHIEYKTEVHFCHKLFCEWYAAHHVSKCASRDDFTFELSPKLDDFAYDRDTIAKHEENILNLLDPFELQYVYRFACGLNPTAAEKIISYLRDRGDADKFIILCILEKSENMNNALKDISDLCSRDVYIDASDSLFLQKSTIQLLQMAAISKNVISKLWLGDCYNSVDVCNGNIQLKSNNCLPALKTLKELVIEERGRKMTKEEILDILNYLKLCPWLKELRFYDCLLPLSIQKESLLILRSEEVQVVWRPNGQYILNLESGRWEDEDEGEEMTTEQYQMEAENVRRYHRTENT